MVLRVPPSQDHHKHLISLFAEQDAFLKGLVLRTIYKREGRGKKITDVLRRIQTRPNRLVQPCSSYVSWANNEETFAIGSTGACKKG